MDIPKQQYFKAKKFQNKSNNHNRSAFNSWTDIMCIFAILGIE